MNFFNLKLYFKCLNKHISYGFSGIGKEIINIFCFMRGILYNLDFSYKFALLIK